MPTDGEEAAANIAARHGRRPDRARAVEADPARGRRARPRRRAPADRRGRQAVRHLDRRRDGDNFFPGLVGRLEADEATAAGRRCGRPRAAAGRAPDGDRRVRRGSCATSWPRSAGRSRPPGRERYQLASQYFLGATVDLDETYAWGFEELARLETEMRAVADKIVGPAARSTTRSPRSTPTRPAASQGKEAFRDWMQALGRQGDRRAARHPLRHPGAGPPDRVLPRADHRRRHLLHRPERGLHPPGPDVVGRAAGHHEFSTWREVTTVYHEGVPGHHLQVAQTAVRAELLNRWQRLLCWVLRARRGLGALRRAADGRARLPGRPGRQARHARRAGVPRRPG